jgi:hypothetical protein
MRRDVSPCEHCGRGTRLGALCHNCHARSERRKPKPCQGGCGQHIALLPGRRSRWCVECRGIYDRQRTARKRELEGIRREAEPERRKPQPHPVRDLSPERIEAIIAAQLARMKAERMAGLR